MAPVAIVWDLHGEPEFDEKIRKVYQVFQMKLGTESSADHAVLMPTVISLSLRYTP